MMAWRRSAPRIVAGVKPEATGSGALVRGATARSRSESSKLCKMAACAAWACCVLVVEGIDAGRRRSPAGRCWACAGGLCTGLCGCCCWPGRCIGGGAGGLGWAGLGAVCWRWASMASRRRRSCSSRSRFWASTRVFCSSWRRRAASSIRSRADMGFAAVIVVLGFSTRPVRSSSSRTCCRNRSRCFASWACLSFWNSHPNPESPNDNATMMRPRLFWIHCMRENLSPLRALSTKPRAGQSGGRSELQ